MDVMLDWTTMLDTGELATSKGQNQLRWQSPSHWIGKVSRTPKDDGDAEDYSCR